MEMPKELIEGIAGGSVTVFIGAGLSQGAGLPGWPKLLVQMMECWKSGGERSLVIGHLSLVKKRRHKNPL